MASEKPITCFNSKDPLTANTTEINDYVYSKKISNYLIGEIIGKGAFATVNESCHTLTAEKVAVKVVNKTLCLKDSYVKKHLRREGKILQQLKHINIVQLLEIMETENSYYLVLELCCSNLMTKIMKKGNLSENETRVYLRQLILAIDYMHRSSIMHRDLKVENILLTKDDILKVADFGVSIQLSTKAYCPSKSLLEENDNTFVPHLCKTQCGSPAYAAPEVLSKSLYDYSADVWSIGVNMFAMLTGKLPFTVKPFSIEALKDKMMKRDMQKLSDDINNDCKELLLQFLNPDSQKRITLREAMQHPWLNFEVSSRWNHGINTFDINTALINYMNDNLEFKKADTIKAVLHNLPNASHATYYLLMNKAQRFCQLHQISLTKWLYSLCPQVESNQDNKTIQKLNPFNEITNSKPRKINESSFVNRSSNDKLCEDINHKPRTFKSLISNPSILTKRQSISSGSTKSSVELNTKYHKYPNITRVLPHINEISIPYFTNIAQEMVQKSYIFNPSRSHTVVNNYRKMSVTEDIGNLSKSRLESSFRKKNDEKFQLTADITRQRRYFIGYSMKYTQSSVNK